MRASGSKLFTAWLVIGSVLPVRTSFCGGEQARYSGFVTQTQRSADAAIQRPTYLVTDLGTLGGQYSEAYGVNRYGEVVGIFSVPGSGFPSEIDHAFVWSRGQMFELPALPEAGEVGSRAYDINDAGVIVGVSLNYDSPTIATAVRWTPIIGGRQVQRIGASYVSIAVAISATGRVAGYDYTDYCPSSSPGAWRWYVGGTVYLSPLVQFAQCETRDINSTGQVVGISATSANACLWFSTGRPVLWSATGTVTDLGTLGGTGGTAEGINDLGQVVGISRTTAADSHAFLWLPSPAFGLPAGMNDLGTLGGRSSSARRINGVGIVVGVTQREDGRDRAVVWNRGVTIDLNAAIPHYPQWTLGYANDVNDLGQIVGTGKIDGEYHAYLATPVHGTIWNLSDFAGFQNCFGRSVSVHVECRQFDLNRNLNVDSDDYDMFLTTFAGP